MRRSTLHPAFYRDAAGVAEYYERVASPGLAEEFRQELDRCLEEAIRQPGAFAAREHGLRRVNLRRFPYHFLFRLADETVRILVLRHHRKHPSFGLGRR